MYDDVVHRTQIYLDDDEVALLEQASRSTGASRSELIRRAVRTLYGAESAHARLAALRDSAGAWSSRTDTGAEYADGVRADLNQRLTEVGLE